MLVFSLSMLLFVLEFCSDCCDGFMLVIASSVGGCKVMAKER